MYSLFRYSVYATHWAILVARLGVLSACLQPAFCRSSDVYSPLTSMARAAVRRQPYRISALLHLLVLLWKGPSNYVSSSGAQSRSWLRTDYEVCSPPNMNSFYVPLYIILSPGWVGFTCLGYTLPLASMGGPRFRAIRFRAPRFRAVLFHADRYGAVRHSALRYRAARCGERRRSGLHRFGRQ